MTREEAKSRLEWIYKNHKCLSLESKHCYEAIKMGAEALENQKTLREELEKIKAEIQDLDLGFVDEEYQAGIAYGIMKFNQILNKHIK